jgi:NADH-quinone oxidoreductase subunit M
MKRASKNNKSIISMTIGLSIKYYGWWLIMVNNVHLYKNNIMIFIMSIITVISIMNWSISTNRIEIARYISYNIVGLYITLILDILIWICIIYERYYIVNKNNMYIVIYYILNLIYLNNNSILILCLLYEYQSIPLISMINNISVINVKNKKGLIISNTLLITYSIISGLILYSSIYKISKSYNIELVQIMNSKVPYIAIISILISGSIKLSIFPFHIWLGKVHVEAPTIGSILLAGISLKTGFYINYIYIFLYKIISNKILNIMVYIIMIGLIINNVVIYYSIDGKRWIALYSIIHMNAYYIILIISKFSIIYITVLIYGMIGHSLISSALFLIIGYIYNNDRINNK